MKKNSICLLIILVLSIIVNINHVNAAITVDGETWDKECKYSGKYNSIKLYIKSGKTMIIDTGVTDENQKPYKIYDGSTRKEYGSYSYIMHKKTLTNNIAISDGKCPVMIYRDHSTYGTITSAVYVDDYTYATSDNGGELFFIDGGNGSMPSIDNKSNEDCGKIIDQTVRNLINKYLGYIHIIVPILVMALGTYDFFRAMIASKEDEMKKAQKRFIIRLVAGVLVFLAPTIVNIIIDILNSVLVGTGNKACGLLTAIQNNIYL